jgi:glycosyltransferase involved in cell wall biosynthesis
MRLSGDFPMRILYLVTKADLGGAQVHILDLLRGFLDRLDLTVATGEEGYFTEAVKNLGVPCHILPNLVHPIRVMKDCRAVFDVVSLINSVEPDVVHTHTSKAGLVGRLAARAAGVPSVYTAHTWCFAEGTSRKWHLSGVPAERLAGIYSSAIVNVSDANRSLALSRGIASPDRHLTIWNGIPDAPHRANPGADGIPNIVMVGRFAEQKDQLLLLRAYAGLRNSARLWFVGEGPLFPAVASEVSRLGVRDRVEFLGRRMDIAEILAHAHVFTLATKWEGFPLSILEAMRAGLPVIASKVGGVPEAVTDGETGLLVEPGDLASLRESLDLLVAQAGIRQKMGDAGRKRYLAHFTVEPMLDKTLMVYQMVALGIRSPHSILRPANNLQDSRVPVGKGRG